MWTTARTLNAVAKPRPVRIAYLIPEAAPDELLDRLIEDSLSRWGGRRTPLIPTDGNKIEPAYWTLLDYWDADILYSYSNLSEELQDRLYYSFAPSEIIMHHEIDKNGNYRPIFYGNYNFLSALSILPILDRSSQMKSASLPEIIDNEIWDDNIRDLADSFGFVSRSCMGMFVHPYARRLSVKRLDYGRQAHEQETTYLENIDQWLDGITQRTTVLTLSRIADTLCPNLQLWCDYKNGWDNHLSVVIGDSIDDRLLAWNAQHRYSNSNLYGISVLRLSPTRFQDGIPEWFKTWITKYNYHTLEHNSIKRVVFRSCSVQKEELDKIAEKIGINYVHLSTEHHKSPDLFEIAGLKTDSAIWSFPNLKVTNISFRNNEIDLPMSTPSHVDISRNLSFFSGTWATELTIERAADHSQYGNRNHVWAFPRRLRLETAIDFKNYAKSSTRQFIQILPPPIRPNKNGNLTIWDCIDWTRPTITMPDDSVAFVKALSEIPWQSPVIRRKLKNASTEARNNTTNFRFHSVTISDKGRDLLGILHFFKSLPEALEYLNNQFLLQVITRLSRPELENKSKYIKIISKMITDFLKDNDQAKNDTSVIAKAALQLAARSFGSQKIRAYTFESIYGQAKEYFEKKQDRGNEIRNELKSSIAHLRNRKFLLQGFYWKCGVCNHENWISLEHLTNTNHCEICEAEVSSPADNSFHFRLNPFVEHAFAASSSQGPVLWCLNQLANAAELMTGRRQSSFSFAPALDLYTTKNLQWTDIDLTANINGLIYLIEVKKSFSNVNTKLIEQLYDVGDKFRPDVVLLAIQAKPSENIEIQNSLKQLGSRLEKLDVKFGILTPEDQLQTFWDAKTIALPFSKTMHWSAW